MKKRIISMKINECDFFSIINILVMEKKSVITAACKDFNDGFMSEKMFFNSISYAQDIEHFISEFRKSEEVEEDWNGTQICKNNSR